MANKQVFFSISLETNKAISSIGELKTLVKNLKKEIDQKNVLDADFEPLKAKLRLAQTELAKFNDSIKSVPSFTQRMAGAFTQSFKQVGGAIAGAFAVGAIIDFGKRSFDLAAQVERDEARLLTALNGRKSIQQTLIAQANELEKTTGIDDREIIKQQTFLALQGRTQQEISKTIEAAIRLSRVTGDDLSSSVEKLDSTLEGNVGKLGKLDGRFKDLTETQLKSGQAIDLINEKYADTLNLQTDAEKATNDFGNSVEDLEKAFGKLLLKLTPVISGLGEVVSAIANIGKTDKDFAIELGISITDKSKEFALKEFNDFRAKLIKNGDSFEEANRKALDSKLKETASLIQASQGVGNYKQTLIYAAELEAVKEVAQADLESYSATQKKKTDEAEKGAKERAAKLKAESEAYKRQLAEEDKLRKESFDKQQQLNKASADQSGKLQSEALKKYEQEQIQILTASYKSKGDFSKEAENKLAQDILQIKIDALEKEKLLNEDDPVRIAELNNKILAYKTEQANKELDLAKTTQEGITAKTAEEVKKREEVEKQSQQILTDAFFNFAEGITSIINESSQQQTQLRLSAIDEQLNAQLSALDIAQQKEEGTYVEQTATQKKFEAERKKLKDQAHKEEVKLKTDQFKKDKEAAIINALINTAQAAVASLARFPLPLGAPILAANIAAGLLQVGLIAARPIPAFKEGVVDFVGKGTETSDSNVVKISKGESVIPASATKKYKPFLESIVQESRESNPLFGKQAVNISSTIPAFANGYIPNSVTNSVNVNPSVQLDMSSIERLIVDQRAFFAAELSKERRSYVVEQDMTTVQNRNRKIENRSLFEAA